MKWEIEVHTIHVGQGESSLIRMFGYDDLSRFKLEAPEAFRQVLIDGGLRNQAATVLKYLDSLDYYSEAPIDLVVCSHFDKDHFGGIKALLEIDNVYADAKVIADTLIGIDTIDLTRPYIIMMAAAFVAAAAYGCYEIPVNDIAESLERVDCSGLYSDIFEIIKNVEEEDLPKRGGVEVLTETSIGLIIDKLFNQFKKFDNVKIVPARLWPDSYVNADGLPTKVAYRNIIDPLASKFWGFVNSFDDNREEILINFIFETLMNTRGYADIRYNIPIGGTRGRFAESKVISPTDTCSMAYKFEELVLYRDRVKGSRFKKIQGNVSRKYKAGYTALQDYIGGKDLITEEYFSTDPYIELLSVDGVINGKQYNITENQVSISLLIVYDGFRFFTAGDMEGENEEALAGCLVKLSIAAFKCGHHGSGNSTKPVFLENAKPRCAVISCGEDNSYRHPEIGTMKRISDCKSIGKCYLTSPGKGEGAKWIAGLHSLSSKFIISRRSDDAPNGDIVLTMAHGNRYFSVQYYLSGVFAEFGDTMEIATDDIIFRV